MTFRSVFLSLLLFGLLFGSPQDIHARDKDFPPVACEKLKEGVPGRVTYVDDGDTVTLADGRRVRLVGLQAPKLPLGRKGFVAWPLGEESREALIDLVQDQDIGLFYGGRETDRYGRHLAHIYRLSDNLWIQSEMIATGMARVYSFPDNRSCVTDMLEKEQVARTASKGMWALEHYALREALKIVDQNEESTFQLVEGRVTSVARVRDRIYINFGEDYRTDFTVTAEGKFRKRLQKDGFPFDTLENKLIRIRGWIYDRNGPMIKLTHPEQMEFLDD